MIFPPHQSYQLLPNIISPPSKLQALDKLRNSRSFLKTKDPQNLNIFQGNCSLYRPQYHQDKLSKLRDHIISLILA